MKISLSRYQKVFLVSFGILFLVHFFSWDDLYMTPMTDWTWWQRSWVTFLTPGFWIFTYVASFLGIIFSCSGLFDRGPCDDFFPFLFPLVIALVYGGVFTFLMYCIDRLRRGLR